MLRCQLIEEVDSSEYSPATVVFVADVKDENNKKVLESLFIRNEEGEISEIIAVDADGNYYTSTRNQERFAVLQNVLDACLTGIKLSTIIVFMPDVNPALTSFFLSRLTRSVNPRNWEFSQFKEVF